MKYNAVDFGSKKMKKVEVKAKSVNGGIVQVRLDKVDGPVIAEVTIPKIPVRYSEYGSDVERFSS